MTKYISGDQEIDVDPVNESVFETAGWTRVEPPKKSDKDEK